MAKASLLTAEAEAEATTTEEAVASSTVAEGSVPGCLLIRGKEGKFEPRWATRANPGPSSLLCPAQLARELGVLCLCR